MEHRVYVIGDAVISISDLLDSNGMPEYVIDAQRRVGQYIGGMKYSTVQHLVNDLCDHDLREDIALILRNKKAGVTADERNLADYLVGLSKGGMKITIINLSYSDAFDLEIRSMIGGLLPYGGLSRAGNLSSNLLILKPLGSINLFYCPNCLAQYCCSSGSCPHDATGLLSALLSSSCAGLVEDTVGKLWVKQKILMISALRKASKIRFLGNLDGLAEDFIADLPEILEDWDGEMIAVLEDDGSWYRENFGLGGSSLWTEGFKKYYERLSGNINF